jgi:membrane-associated phospholipid phosphatase
MPIVLFLIVCLWCSLFPVPSLAQQTELLEPERTGIVAHVLKEQAGVWRSIFQIDRGDVKWMMPLSLGAGALLATDHRVSAGIDRSDSLRPASRFISHFGGMGSVLAGAGGAFALGKLTGQERTAHTGRLALEAVTHTSLVVGGLKLLTQRERPDKPESDGAFWGGGQSFPSGHAATTWAFATVVGHKYRHKPLVKFGAYGLAGAVSLSRIGGQNHHPSDVLIGAAIGHLIGRFVLRRHDDR